VDQGIRGQKRTGRRCRVLATRAALLAICAAGLTGCATLPNGRGWAQDATLHPGKARARKALENALGSPATWAPVALALALQIDGMDERLATWAADETPVFGSREDAARASDRLAEAAGYVYGISLLATPSGEDARSWTVNKLKGGALGYAALATTYGAVDLLKTTTNRTRPDGSDDRSFVSGHAAGSAVHATLASRNAESIFQASAPRAASALTCALLAGSCAWARVEAHKHYPSDVLAGLALGHFIGALVNDAFIQERAPEGLDVSLAPSPKGFTILVTWNP
jgi:membrane-associated phospholipid phosphatase